MSTKPEVKIGRPRKYDYEGVKVVTSIRLTKIEKKKIRKHFKTIQNFVQFCYDQIKDEK